jgi:septation ring formation regulator EzrA
MKKMRGLKAKVDETAVNITSLYHTVSVATDRIDEKIDKLHDILTDEARKITTTPDTR